MLQNQEEIVDIVFILNKSYRNCLLTSRVHVERCPDRAHTQAFQKLLDISATTGSAKLVQLEGCQSRRRLMKCQFLRQLSKIIIMSYPIKLIGTLIFQRVLCIVLFRITSFIRSLLNCTRNCNLKTFKLSTCTWVIHKIDREQFYLIMLFSDESTFHKNGVDNRHNFHYYADEIARAPQEWETTSKDGN